MTTLPEAGAPALEVSLPLLSVVVLSYNSHIDKASSIISCLLSIVIQDFARFEVVVVENSSDKSNTSAIASLLQHYRGLVNSQIISPSHSLSKGDARNLGAQAAVGNCFLFVDDDTIILSRKAFSLTWQAFEKADFGCGATRYWTAPGWSAAQAQALNRALLDSEDLAYFGHAPLPYVRGQADTAAEQLSFIGNFGFCRRESFFSVGGFPDFPINSWEDDYLMLQLAAGGHRFATLEAVKVLHIHHAVLSRQEEAHYYFSKIVKQGYFEFDAPGYVSSGGLFDAHVKLLETIHYDEQVEAAYRDYCCRLPLNINASNRKEVAFWRANNQHRLQDFAMVLSKLIEAGSLSAYQQRDSIDFDNLAPLLQAMIAHQLIQIEDNGFIKPGIIFEYPYIQSAKITQNIIWPEAALNQFPCDEISLKRRLQLLKQRYPYCKYLSIALIGDDDLLTRLLAPEYWVYPTVIDTDSRVLTLAAVHSDRNVIHSVDLRTADIAVHLSSVKPCHTFFCDPPYTKAGVLLFLYAGLLTTFPAEWSGPQAEFREFYLIANRAMLGNSFFEINNILASCRIYLYDCLAGFSNYPFPAHFDEYTRSLAFAKSLGKNIRIEQSSTSDLFIYRSRHPDVELLQSHLSPNDIYEHFQ